MRAFWNAVRIALRAIARSKLRAALTVLGILIGVAAVVIVVALGTGTRDAITAKFATLGANIIYMWPQPTQQSGVRQATRVNLTEADGEAIVREATSIATVVPFSSTAAQLVYLDKNWPTQAMGVTRNYWAVRKYDFAKGQSWTETDELLKTKVCVIGDTIREQLFGSADPIGQYLRIGRYPFRIVGVLEKKGNSPFGEDQDDRVLLPVGSFRARLFPMPPGRVMTLMASAKTENQVDRATQQITEILRQRHKIPPDGENDFAVRSPLELRRSLEKIFDTLTVLLSAIAGVSLLVGGVGVMNIMLVSVTERTREIGIRMAIGAKADDILVQFLVEAIVLSMLGGFIGILAGWGLIRAVSAVLDWPLAMPIPALIVAVCTSAAIGTLFGWLPARRAANLDPITALRNE